jgi:hypothetical protein
LNQAVDLRAHFGHLEGGGAARQLGRDAERFRRHFEDAHFRRLRGFGAARAVGRGLGTTGDHRGYSDQDCGRRDGRLYLYGFHIGISRFINEQNDRMNDHSN